MWLIMAVSVLVIVAYGMFGINRIGNGLINMAEQELPLIHLISSIANKQLEQSISLERAIRHGETIAISEDAGQADIFFKESIENYKKYSLVIATDFLAAEKLIASDTAGDRGQARFENIETLLTDIKSTHQGYEQTAGKVFDELKMSRLAEAAALYSEITANTNKLKKQFHMILAELEKSSHQEAEYAREYERNAFIMLGLIGLVTLIISTPFAWWVILKVSRGMSKAVTMASKIASGDLAYTVENREQDEIGQLLDALLSMQRNLRTMISQISEATTSLESSAKQVYTACDRSNENIKQQQSEISLVATAMNEMSATVNEVAKNAEETATSAATSNSDASHGNEVVGSTITSINEVEAGVKQAAETIQKVGDDSENISTILDVIKEIAEQTNLLALNAAIEAARAGDKGRGFAVVADEVRVLAQRTQDSTHEIEEMIMQLQTGAKKAVVAMEAGEKAVIKSVEHAGEAGIALQKITQAVEKISDMNTQIASASVEQASVAEEMNQNLTKAHTLSDENATLIQQTYINSEELSTMATQLKNLMQQFRL